MTLLGCVLASWQGTARQFIGEWYRSQGFFLTGMGTWITLIVRTGALETQARKLTRDGSLPSEGVSLRWLRRLIVFAVGIGGSVTINGLGFPARGAVLLFFWVACSSVCFVAGIVTLHAIDMLLLLRGLQRAELKIYRYSPARTPELRSLVSYCISFTLLMTIGYAFCTIGTVLPSWTSSREYSSTVQFFWPIIYVPTCSIALVYPHIVVHQIVKREKERTLASCQREIEHLLDEYPGSGSEYVQRTNSVAELFDRISATPDYVVDFAIAAKTVLPLLFNVITLVAKVAGH
jgi:hypothetical protein